MKSKRKNLLLLIAFTVVFSMAGFLTFAEGPDEEFQTIKVGVLPYFDYQPFVGAHEIGLDRELGLDLELIPFPNENSGVRALVTGSIDVCEGSVDVVPNIIPQTPELRVFLNVAQFKGFQVIGREGKVKVFDDILREKGGDFDAAVKAVYSQLDGKTFTINKTSYEGTVSSMLENADLTLDDVTILDFADDAKAAAAFLRGEGDFYVGSLPQQVRMLKEPGFVAVSGNETIGPGGLWFSNAFAMEDFVNENKDVILKLAAIHYRTIRYMHEKPDLILPAMVDFLNKSAATNMTVAEAKNLMEKFIDFFTLESSKTSVYGGSKSPTYWKTSVDYYIKQNEDMGKLSPGAVKAGSFVIQEKIFNELLKDRELIDWINKPL